MEYSGIILKVYSIQIKGKATEIQKMVNKRRTWIGIEDDGRFEPVQMPTTGVTEEMQTT